MGGGSEPASLYAPSRVGGPPAAGAGDDPPPGPGGPPFASPDSALSGTPVKSVEYIRNTKLTKCRKGETLSAGARHSLLHRRRLGGLGRRLRELQLGAQLLGEVLVLLVVLPAILRRSGVGWGLGGVVGAHHEYGKARVGGGTPATSSGPPRPGPPRPTPAAQTPQTRRPPADRGAPRSGVRARRIGGEQ